MLDFIAREFPKDFKKIRFGTAAASAEWQAELEKIGAPARPAPVQVGIGLKPVSYLGTERLMHSALSYAVKYQRKSVTIVHKGNIMKFTSGAFRDWCYGVARTEFGAVEIDGGPWCRIPEGKPGAGIVIKDCIADIALQQVLTRPTDFDVIATPNLNGDYLSDALAAQVGGIGIAPGGNINYLTGHAIFEATHGTAPKYAGKDVVNPGSVVLSGEMMLRHLGWIEAADLILQGLERRDRQQARHLRLCPADGGRHRDQMLRVRRQSHRAHVMARRPAADRWPVGSRHAGVSAAVDEKPRSATFRPLPALPAARDRLKQHHEKDSHHGRPRRRHRPGNHGRHPGNHPGGRRAAGPRDH